MPIRAAAATAAADYAPATSTLVRGGGGPRKRRGRLCVRLNDLIEKRKKKPSETICRIVLDGRQLRVCGRSVIVPPLWTLGAVCGSSASNLSPAGSSPQFADRRRAERIVPGKGAHVHTVHSLVADTVSTSWPVFSAKRTRNDRTKS